MLFRSNIRIERRINMNLDRINIINHELSNFKNSIDSKIDSSVSTFYEWFCGVRKGLIFLDVEGDLERRLTMDEGYVL